MTQAEYKQMFDKALPDKALCHLTVSKMEAAGQKHRMFPSLRPMTAVLVLFLAALLIPASLMTPTYCQFTSASQPGPAGDTRSSSAVVGRQMSSAPSLKEEGERVMLANGEIFGQGSPPGLCAPGLVPDAGGG